MLKRGSQWKVPLKHMPNPSSSLMDLGAKRGSDSVILGTDSWFGYF